MYTTQWKVKLSACTDYNILMEAEQEKGEQVQLEHLQRANAFVNDINTTIASRFPDLHILVANETQDIAEDPRKVIVVVLRGKGIKKSDIAQERSSAMKEELKTRAEVAVRIAGDDRKNISQAARAAQIRARRYKGKVIRKTKIINQRETREAIDAARNIYGEKQTQELVMRIGARVHKKFHRTVVFEFKRRE